MAETYESKINREPVQGWTRRTVADGDYLQSKTIQPLVNRDSILAKGLDDTNTLVNGMSDKVDNVETKCNAQEALVKSLSGDVEDFCTSATEAFEQIKTNEQTLAGNVEDVQQSVNKLSNDVWQMNFMGFKDSTTVFVKEEIEQGKHMFSFSSVGGGGGGSNNVYVPNVDSEGNLKYDISATSASQAHVGPWNIRGPRGLNGQDGAKGADGFSPTITLTPVGQTGGHNNGGTQVEITFKNGESTTTTAYTAWNGNDGSMAGAPDIEGDNGVSALYNGSKYFVGLSGGVYVPSLSAGSADKAGYSELAGSATYAEKFKVDNTDYTFSDLYSEVNTLSSASGRWDAHSALSATKLDKSIWDNNSGKFVTSAGLTGDDKQYAMTTTGWAEITGGGSSFTGAETNNWISGDGTSNKPIGLSAEAASAIEAMADQYQIDGGQYISVVPDSTERKVIVGLDNDAANKITRVGTSANNWDTVSAKSKVTIDNTLNSITTENQGVTKTISAVKYDLCETNEPTLVVQNLIVGTSSGAFVDFVNQGKCNGQGTLFFWADTMGPWVPPTT